MMLIVCSMYLMVVMMMLGCMSLLSLLLMLEVLSWLFITLLPNISILNYLIIQSYFLVMSLSSAIFLPSILIISFLLKLGLPPFHIWFMRVSSTLNKLTFSFMMTIHKLLPIILLSKIMFSVLSFIFISMSLFMAGLALISSSTLFFTLLFSSMVHSIWMMLSMLMSKSFLMFYWFIYSFLFIILVSLLVFMKLEQSYLIQSVFTSKCWLMMSGIPPFMLFWLKVYLLIWLAYSVSFFMSIMIMFVSVFALTSYYRTWHYGSLVEYSYISSMSLSPILMVFLFWSMF